MKEAKRIWLLSNEFEPQIIGGLGTAVTNLAKAYVRTGAVVTVISQNDRPRVASTKRRRLHIVRFPLKSTYYGKKMRQFKSVAIEHWLRRQRLIKPDAIHIHSIQFKNLAKYVQTKYRVPVVYTCHSLIRFEPGPSTRKKRVAQKNQVQLLKLANKVVVPSRAERKKLIKMYPFCAKKCVVIHHGINVRKVSMSHASPYRLLFVGRLVSSKGIVPLFKAIRILKRHEKNVRLDLVGKGSKSYMRKLRQQLKKLGITAEVRLLGYRDQRQVQRMYTTYGAVVMPSQQESFGLVALEALASGVPLVSTRAGGLAEFVNGTVAQTIPRVQANAIATAIQKMWRHRSLTTRRVQAGLKLAAKYQWPDAARKYKKLFSRLR